MPVKEFFEDQLRQLKEFMADPGQTVRVVAVDTDLRPVLVKMLAGLDRDPDNPHVLIPSDAGFTTRNRFFADLLADLLTSYEASAEELRAAGIHEPFNRTDLTRELPEQRVTLYLSALAEGLPDHVGSLVVLLDPEEVADPAGFRKALAWLADTTWSAWVKYLVVDDRLKPRTAGLGQMSRRTREQVMYLSPEEFERRLREAVVSDGNLLPNVRRQYTGMLGGFALSRKDYALAAECYEQQAELTRLDGVPAEEAQAHYCLGNALLGKQDFPAAEAAYVRALELTLTHQQPQLMGLVLTQLGVALSRQGRAEEAAESFRIARHTARNTGVPPLEAYALDTQAGCLLAAKDPAAAERCWQEALAVYDGITSDAFPDVREAGRTDILAKLEHLYKTTRQPGRWAELLRTRGAA